MRVLITAFAALTLGALGRVSPLGAQGPTTTSPDAWPQFRGNTSLTGVSGSTLPDELTLQWTYEADAAIDSSAAIVAAIKVNSPRGVLHRCDPHRRTLMVAENSKKYQKT